MSTAGEEVHKQIVETCREQLDALVRSIEEGLDEGRPSYVAMLVCVVAIMKELHKVRGMGGSEKRELLKAVVLEALSTHLDEDELDIVEDSLDAVVDSLWDLGQKVVFPAARRCRALCCC